MLNVEPTVPAEQTPTAPGTDKEEHDQRCAQGRVISSAPVYDFAEVVIGDSAVGNR
jgi:hypothetical protein